jgi:hypothetical protein
LSFVALTLLAAVVFTLWGLTDLFFGDGICDTPSTEQQAAQCADR